MRGQVAGRAGARPTRKALSSQSRSHRATSVVCAAVATALRRTKNRPVTRRPPARRQAMPCVRSDFGTGQEWFGHTVQQSQRPVNFPAEPGSLDDAGMCAVDGDPGAGEGAAERVDEHRVHVLRLSISDERPETRQDSQATTGFAAQIVQIDRHPRQSGRGCADDGRTGGRPHHLPAGRAAGRDRHAGPP